MLYPIYNVFKIFDSDASKKKMVLEPTKRGIGDQRFWCKRRQTFAFWLLSEMFHFSQYHFGKICGKYLFNTPKPFAWKFFFGPTAPSIVAHKFFVIWFTEILFLKFWPLHISPSLLPYVSSLLYNTDYHPFYDLEFRTWE